MSAASRTNCAKLIPDRRASSATAAWDSRSKRTVVAMRRVSAMSPPYAHVRPDCRRGDGIYAVATAYVLPSSSRVRGDPKTPVPGEGGTRKHDAQASFHSGG